MKALTNVKGHHKRRLKEYKARNRTSKQMVINLLLGEDQRNL